MILAMPERPPINACQKRVCKKRYVEKSTTNKEGQTPSDPRGDVTSTCVTESDFRKRVQKRKKTHPTDSEGTTDWQSLMKKGQWRRGEHISNVPKSQILESSEALRRMLEGLMSQ